ncbi:PTS transporter subunit EIIC [Limosilactobacillus reuteri]|uniref:PTS transporter subunit EIIC n=1 Tax=Limosilactobacillus reuteri TaxID=1598 RepID=UPI001E602D8D|nr:PTS transporter subunit EIIC [Limosilactobacillus reuteri]MCC4435462.1 PTS transporter subunit EIIC [Limosilactobacillus reuteri]MCC4437644.1 PTS transporter subunit EIIC [Limosilactobacillus reuteri]MCC4442152.1 PTS transporter subunit EIIC [Limosilactobacillus reuteri]MCC4444092.1 PTS transporter subunit EIIC [Limosilactobacillus reuteri]MCC4446344.1 PTS transporter subunit EIIC [Limosilactobacillus reuteri]
MDKNEKLIKRAMWFNRLSFVQIFRETMIMLFPVALIGTIVWIISDNLLASNGFLANVFYIQQWLPERQFLRALFNDATMITVGWLASYAAFVSAIMTTRRYRRENLIAGVCAMISYVLIFYHSVRGSQTLETRYFGAGWLIIGSLVGYVIGLIFVKWGYHFTLSDIRLGSRKLMARVLRNLKPFTISFSGAFILHTLYAVWRTFNLDAITTQNISSLIGRHSNYFLNITLSFFNTLLVWLGFAEPVNITNDAYSNEVRNNLIYALTHKSFAVPYPFTLSSLYNGFANFGGIGVTLALVIGILWVGRQNNQQEIAKLSVFPAIFNHGLPILFGSRVFLNPVYVFPFILLPIANMLVASVFIFIHAIPPIVYPVPNGTPGILIPFIGTGGDWRALLISILLVIMDIIIYIPFIKLAFAVEERLVKEQEEFQNEDK